MEHIAFEKFRKAVECYSMLNSGDKVLVGFSGGADSCALLSMLTKRSDIKVAAVHVHHGIRGEEADRDEKFCFEFCASHSIPYFVIKKDVPKLSEECGKGLEEVARNVRYTAFEQISLLHCYNKIATAHNASDNIETVIFNLTRGCGLDGLCGIPPVRDNIIRPLILCSKDEIIEYCVRNEINFVTDSTNSDTVYTRNYIRHEIVPRLKVLNPSLEASFSSLCKAISSERNYLSSVSSAYSFECGRHKLCELDYPILIRVLKNELAKNGISSSSVQLSELYKLLCSDKASFSLSLTGGEISVDRNYITVNPEAVKEIREMKLSFGKNLLSDGSIIYLSQENHTEEIIYLKNIYKLSIYAEVNSAKIINASVRGRLCGDRCVIGGMTRIVRKLLQSKKLSLKRKKLAPIITADGEIIWVPPLPVCDCAKPSGAEDTSFIYYFTNND